MTAKSRKPAKPPKSPSERSATTERPAATKNTRRTKAPEPAPASGATSKQQRCLDLLARRDGATLSELMSATEWQPHSVRGFLSGTVKKKLGLMLTSSRDADGTRRYALERPARGQ
ncbi:MAG: DUF3489 domain-containing protein [Alphaproteobacteria bacterium]|nr:DUF3489 domain-containing protein [Alphaproteobacteria bacterium]